MRAPQMRHTNSPEERAAREAKPETSRSSGFRHYNSPEEVARRAAQGEPIAPIAPQAAPAAPVASEPWPPPGEDNTASVAIVTTAQELSEALVHVATVVGQEAPRRGARVQLSDDEYRELRRVLNNYSALEDAHVRLTRRVRALELALEEGSEAPEAPDAPEAPEEPEAPESSP